MNTNKKSITLMLKIVGTSCNMKCKYCYEHVNNNSKAGINEPIEVIEYLSEYIHYENVFIVFHGGEPLLAKPNDVLIILNYIKESFIGNWNVQFQTNGTLLNDIWIDIFNKFSNNISLSISLDPVGKKDLRILEGRNYRKIIFDNIKKYKKCIDNIGIISVAHAYNINYFHDFIRDLINLGISNLTINKYQTIDINNEYFISELQYVYLLKEISIIWIRNKYYKHIKIQPLVSLFSSDTNKICTYLADENKCSYFKTFYNKKDKFEYCDHIMGEYCPSVDRMCLKCDIYSKCGGGCLVEIKDDTFCEARRNLFHFIKEVKNENQ